jgi:RNA polymerase sigma-70 factor (ECF subfamily)
MAVTVPAVLGEQPRLGFEELYAAYQSRVYRTCLAILRNHDDAAEATQEVFSRALPLLTTLREPQVWLQTVARNLCFDQLRRQKVRGYGAPLDDDIPALRNEDPERETMLRDALRQAFEALSPRERRALARVLLMDDSLSDIAAQLGISYGAAAQVVSRARRRAALAARAVIGAGLAALVRLTLPRERSKATRLAAQAVESGQHLLLAAAVVLTAGGLARAAHPVPPASADDPGPVQLTPAAAHGVVATPPTRAQPPSRQLTVPPAPSLLPPGYRAGPFRVTINGGDGGTDHSGTPQPPSSPVNVTVAPVYGEKCKGADVSAGPGSNPNAVSRSVVVCAP